MNGIGRLIAAGILLATLATSAQAGKVLWTAPALGAYPSLQTLLRRGDGGGAYTVAVPAY